MNLTIHRLNRQMRRGRRRGAALLMALFALTLTATASTAFVKARDQSVAVGRATVDAARARTIAGQGVAIAKEILAEVFRTTDENQAADWRAELADGVLLDNYQVGDAVLNITIADIATGLAPSSATTDFRAGVTVTLGDSSFAMDAEMSLASFVDGQFAIWAEKEFTMTGTNFVGLWENAPQSSHRYAVNIGTEALESVAGTEGVVVEPEIYLEGDPVLASGLHASLQAALVADPAGFGRGSRTGATMVDCGAAVSSYSFSEGANPLAEGSWVAVASADEACKTFIHHPLESSVGFATGDGLAELELTNMEAGADVAMIDPPGEPNFSNGQTYNGDKVYSGQTKTLNPFRVNCVYNGNTPVSGGDLTITNNSVITFKSGVYRIEDRFLVENSRVIIDGNVKFLVKGRRSASEAGARFTMTNSSIELKDNSKITYWVSRDLSFDGSWVGKYVTNGGQNNSPYLGDGHMKNWLGNWAASACQTFPPEEPQYLEPWRFNLYHQVEGASESHTWRFNNSSVVGSILNNPAAVELTGDSQIYGRIAAYRVRMSDSASFFYDHELDDEAALTEGAKPPRGGSYSIPTRIELSF